jgi:hypothetical protein
VATPVSFVTFLISLYIVDNHYRAWREQRRYEHEANGGSRPWLHQLLYYRRPPPYSPGTPQSITTSTATATATTTVHISSSERDGVVVTHTTRSRSGSAEDDVDGDNRTWYYHSKQKKLFKMEAADAFALRQSVFVVLLFSTVAASWLLWRLMRWFLPWFSWFFLNRVW